MAVKNATLAKFQEKFNQYTYLRNEIEGQCARAVKAQIETMEQVAFNNMLEADKLLLHAHQTGQPAKIIQEAAQLSEDTFKTWQQLQEIINPKPIKKEKRKWYEYGKKSWEIFDLRKQQGTSEPNDY